MTEIAKFDADGVATIYKDNEHILEAYKRADGFVVMTIHRFSEATGLWEDLSIAMPSQRFSVLGSLAVEAPASTEGGMGTFTAHQWPENGEAW